MRQSFEDITDPTRGAERVGLLRKELKRMRLDGYIVPRSDEHQGEYVPACAERLFWLTGFSGSAGTAVVLTRKAAIFVDGRYTVQAREQTDHATFELRQVPGDKLSNWIAENAGKGARIGYDPKLHTLSEIEQLEKALATRGIELVAVEENLVDAVWSDRPPPPTGMVVPHPIEYAGVSADSKIADVRKHLKDAGEDALLLTMPDSIAWLLNIRGSDLPHTPFALGFAIVHAGAKPELFMAPAKLDGTVKAHVAASATVRKPDELAERFAALGKKHARVRVDPETAGKWFADTLTAAGAVVVRGPDPCQLAKARKNATEIAGARAAHLRDGAVMCRFLAWLDREAKKGSLDEIAVAERLRDMRMEAGALDLSFETISAAGPHAAMPHYRVSRRSNVKIPRNGIFLVDSGGQYRDGTTDITRTIAVGNKVEAEAKERNTLVLKGMIAISLARFPKGTRGCDLDPFARRALWQHGFDFDHGTGHGIGSYLSVHEGPQRLSRTGTVPFEPGMIVSNEPGYYKAGHYGIRIENLVLVREPEVPAGGERPMLSFETLTLAPIDRRLVVKRLLDATERQWLDAYHSRVMDEIGPRLDARDQTWLEAVTRPI